MAKTETATISALIVDEISDVFEQDGQIVVVVKGPPGQYGLVLTSEQADELAGALIERPQSGHHEAFGSGKEHVVDVSEHLVEQADPDSYVFQISSESGTKLTFRMGTRRLRRIRDTMTAQLAQKLVKKRQ